MPRLLQRRSQRAPRAGQTRFDGTQRHTERIRDVVIAQTVDLAKHDGGPFIERERLERRPQAFGQMLAIELAIGTGAVLIGHLAVGRDVVVERHLLPAIPPPPPALAVPGLIHDDAEDPGTAGGLTAEAMDSTEDPQKDLLRDVEGFLAIAEQIERELKHHPLVLGDELGTRLVVAGSAALDERCFPPAQLRPGFYAYRFEHQVLAHLLPPL